MAPLNKSSAQPRHFLFMLPASATEAERKAVIESARRLASRGYVYIASPDEKTMEDRDEIRFMPLNLDVLPCFGSVTSVCVVRDQTIAIAAREAYPGTEVIVIDPLEGRREEEDAGKPAAWKAAAAAVSQAA